ncbi:hypothetical protein DFH06DRAFT_1369158 [Mycena polygramma]|nr:hypothetical protein DFH06DRAFT_1369158 [Mycena polygramma]
MVHLPKAITQARNNHALCANTAGLSVLLPSAALAKQICNAAQLVVHEGASDLAIFAVEQTAKLIESAHATPCPSDLLFYLEAFSSTLENMEKHVRSFPAVKGPFKNFLAKRQFQAGAESLKEQLMGDLELIEVALTLDRRISAGPHAHPTRRLTKTIPGMAAIARLVISLFDAPLVNSLKPIAVISGMILETAQNVESNREAVDRLAKHAHEVSNFIVDRADEDYRAAAREEIEEDLAKLWETLRQVYIHIAMYEKREWTSRAILVKEDQKQFKRLHSELEDSLQLFTTKQVFATGHQVRLLIAAVSHLRHKLTTTVSLLVSVALVSWIYISGLHFGFLMSVP